MNKAYLSWPLMALGLAACASVADRDAPAAPQTLSPVQIVAARQSAFHLSAATFGSMKTAIDGQADVKTQAFGARGLARWARTLPTLFPEQTASVPSRAKPEIWANKADFDAKAAAYAAAGGRLAELADAGDKTGFATQWAAVRASCAACHDLYRSEPKPAS
jgi:cytochrome c556